MSDNPQLEEQSVQIGQQRGFSDFVVYVDESGDHSLISVDRDYPVFVLAFCIFYKGHYLSNVVPQLQRLKFDYFGHDLVILHEHEIRKEKGDFNTFKNRVDKNRLAMFPLTVVECGTACFR